MGKEQNVKNEGYIGENQVKGGGGNPNEKDIDPREISRDIPRQPPGDYPTAPPKERVEESGSPCVTQEGSCGLEGEKIFKGDKSDPKQPMKNEGGVS